MSALRESRAVVADVETRILETSGDGDPVLLLHGFSDSADTWRPILREFAARGRRGIAVDLPGFGAAGPIGRGPLLPELDRFIGALVEREESPGLLVGNSMGGLAVVRAALQGDLPVNGYAAVSPAGFGFHRSFDQLSSLLDQILPVLRIVYRAPIPKPVVQLYASLFYRFRLAQGAIDPWLALRYGRHFEGMADLRRFGALGRLLAQEIADEPLSLDSLISPLLLIWGADDHICDIAPAREAVQNAPSARLEVLRGCGHSAQIQRPELVADLLTQMSDALTTGADGVTRWTS